MEIEQIFTAYQTGGFRVGGTLVALQKSISSGLDAKSDRLSWFSGAALEAMAGGALEKAVKGREAWMCLWQMAAQQDLFTFTRPPPGSR